MQELWFLCSARRPMLTDIYMQMTFCEDSLNGLQVIKRKRFCDGQLPKGNNSKSI